MKKLLLLLLVTYCGASVQAQSFNVSPPTSLPSAYGNYHPQVEMTNDNRAVVLWTSTTLKNVYFAKHNGVDDFATPIQINPAGFTVQSYNWSGPDMAMWDDDIYIVFKAAGYMSGHVYLVKSTDNGDTFGDTVRIDNLAAGFPQYPDVAVYNDTVFVTYMDHDASGLDPQYV